MLRNRQYSAYPTQLVNHGSPKTGEKVRVALLTGKAPNHRDIKETDETIINWSIRDVF